MSISGKTKVFCLIGHPVEHSMSPTMWNPALEELGLDYVYVAYDVHPDDLKKAVEGFRALDIKGINVTIPHKENIIPYLDEIEPIAKKMGAINTIKNEAGHLRARNTDAGGAKKSLIDAGFAIAGTKVLILGAGGVSRALSFTLAEAAQQVVITDIVEEKATNLAREVQEKMDVNIIGKLSTERTIEEEISKADLLVNATPLGMYPKIDVSPIDKTLLHEDLFVFDVVYNPLQTKLIKEAKELGCNTLGGLDMLVNQGVLAFEWWTGKSPNSKLMKSKIIEFLGIT
ncbi:MAG: shikimate dehydrogenase [Promethearchaeota archaeon]|nr:MAG: shikimate dehydrogenase [Candidatus Lokiarchaeota archaeon]